MSLTGKHWHCSTSADKEAQARALAGDLGILPAAARVLVNRGLSDTRQAEAFLNPGLDQLFSPWLMRGMDQAVARIGQALERGQKLVVHGDYDADGITAAVILVETLRQLGGCVDYYLPSRFAEGYGLHREALDRIKAGGASLVITVDCGINAAAEVAYANQLGLEIIITDHHQPLVTLEGSAAVLNPLGSGCSYPFKELSGAGIAFKLACGLAQKSGLAFPKGLLDLAALGTVADVVPLLGENRALVACGLLEIKRLRRPGLAALIEAAGIKPAQLHSGSLAFILAPSINAAGRMGEAEPAAQLLLEQDPRAARELAEHLRRENQRRRDTEQQILQEASAAVRSDPAAAGENVITLGREGWHHGVIGIVASRLAETFYRPVVLIALENGVGRGSARSIAGFNITAALTACASLLERYGGHEQAAGLTVDASRIGDLRKGLNCYAAPLLKAAPAAPDLILDGEVGAAELSLELARQLAALQPFGAANPVPSLHSKGWELSSWRLVGAAQNHLKLNLVQESRRINPVFFAGAALEPSLYRGRSVDLAFTLKEGAFRGEPSLDIELKDLRYSDSALCGRVEVIDRRCRENRLGYLKELLGRRSGAIAVFAATQYRKESLEGSLPAGAPLFFLTSGGANGARPAKSMPETGTLLLYDLPLYADLLDPFFRACSGTGPLDIHLLYGADDRALNRVLLDLSLPTAGVLEEIYLALAETAAAGRVHFPGPAASALAIKPGAGFWQRCQTVFAEAGLLQEADAAGLTLGPAPADWTEGLERSPAFRAAREMRERCRRFEDLLLEGSGEELARCWDEQIKGKNNGGTEFRIQNSEPKNKQQ